MKLANIIDSKSIAARLAGSSPASGTKLSKRGYFRNPPISTDPLLRAYVIGLAIGDGNLSNPNGRAVRLRISCDLKYPNLILKIKDSLQLLLPSNKIMTIKKVGSCVDVYAYSKHFESLLGWKAKGGSKYMQNIQVPLWIMKNPLCISKCLCGLFETDGSIYFDRGYKMINFVTTLPPVSKVVMKSIKQFGFNPHLYKFENPHALTKYTIRLSKNVQEFITLLGINKT